MEGKIRPSMAHARFPRIAIFSYSSEDCRSRSPASLPGKCMARVRAGMNPNIPSRISSAVAKPCLSTSLWLPPLAAPVASRTFRLPFFVDFIAVPFMLGRLCPAWRKHNPCQPAETRENAATPILEGSAAVIVKPSDGQLLNAHPRGLGLPATVRQPTPSPKETLPKTTQDPTGKEQHVHSKHAQEEPDHENTQPFYELHALITLSRHLNPHP